MMRHPKALILAFTFTSVLSAERYAIMYDLGGTLVDTSQLGVASSIGLLTSALYYFFDRPASVRQRIFETLEAIGGKQDGLYKVEDGQGNVVPRIMAEYLAGNYRDTEALSQKLLAEVDTLRKQKFFVSEREYLFIKNAIKTMFDPEIIIANTYGLRDMLALFERINPEEHDVIIVSNWDSVGFDLFMESPVGKQIGARVKPEYRIVSGKIGINKPDPAFFRHTLEKFNLKPESCILIDNDAANISCAEQELGIFCVHFTGNVKAVESELIARGIIKS